MTDHPEIRIGDRERLRTQDRLRDAYGQGALNTDELEERLELALRARTQSDLVPLVADLPPPLTDSAVEPVPPPPVPAPRDDDDDEADGDERSWRGRLTLAAVAIIAVVAVASGALEPPAIFGGRTIMVGPESDDVRVLALFGGIEVVVEEGTTVDERVMAIFGGTDCDGVCDTGNADVTVTGLALFGGINIVPEDAEQN